jgi:hypothetical protein
MASLPDTTFRVFVHIGVDERPASLSADLYWLASNGGTVLPAYSYGPLSYGVGWMESQYEAPGLDTLGMLAGQVRGLPEPTAGTVAFYIPLQLADFGSGDAIALYMPRLLVVYPDADTASINVPTVLTLGPESAAPDPVQITTVTRRWFTVDGQSAEFSITGRGLTRVAAAQLLADTTVATLTAVPDSTTDSTLTLQGTFDAPQFGPRFVNLTADYGVDALGPEVFVIPGRSYPPTPPASSDNDGNGIDDADEVLLARKFCPSVVTDQGDTEGKMRPAPVGLIGNGANPLVAPHELRMPQLHVSFLTLNGALFCSGPVNDPVIWAPDPIPPWVNPDYDYSMLTGEPVLVAGRACGIFPPDPYYMFLHPDYGGYETQCPDTWETLYLNGHADSDPGTSDHVAGTALQPTTYAHLYRDGASVVIQYWYFYPYNDFLNQHEGDWEHVNVKVSSVDPDAAEIQQIAFYFHHKYLVRAPQASDVHICDGTHPVVWSGGYTEYGGCGICASPSCGGMSGAASHGSYPEWGKWFDVYDPPVCGSLWENIRRCGNYLDWSDFDIEIIPEPGTINFQQRPELGWLDAGFGWGTLDVPTYCDNTANVDGNPPAGPTKQSTWNAFSGGSGFSVYTGLHEIVWDPATLVVPSDSLPTLDAALACALCGDEVVVNVIDDYYSTRGHRLPSNVTFKSTYGGGLVTVFVPPMTPWLSYSAGSVGGRIGGPDASFFFELPGTGLPADPIAISLPQSGDVAVEDNIFEQGGAERKWIAVSTPAETEFEVPGGTVTINRNEFYGVRTGFRLAKSGLTRPAQLVGNDFLFCDIGVLGMQYAEDPIVLSGLAQPQNANDFVNCGVNVHFSGPIPPGSTGTYNYWGAIDSPTILSRLTGTASGLSTSPWWDQYHNYLFYANPVGVPTSSSDAITDLSVVLTPNPAHASVEMALALPSPGPVRVSVFDPAGRLLRVVHERYEPQGRQRLRFDLSDLASGHYFVTIDATGRRETRRLTLLR